MDEYEQSCKKYQLVVLTDIGKTSSCSTCRGPAPPVVLVKERDRVFVFRALHFGIFAIFFVFVYLLLCVLHSNTPHLIDSIPSVSRTTSMLGQHRLIALQNLLHCPTPSL